MFADPAPVQEAAAVIIEPAHEATPVHRNAPQRAQNALVPHVAVTLAVFQSRQECVTFHAASQSPLVVLSHARLAIEAQVVTRVLTRVTAMINLHKTRIN